MTNTTELRKYSVKLVCGECDGHGSRQKFEAEDNKLGICTDCWGNGALNDKVHEFYKSEMQDQIEQAERAKEEQFKEATVKFFEKQKEIALIRGDDFWAHEFDLQIFGQPLEGCSLLLTCKGCDAQKCKCGETVAEPYSGFDLVS